MPFRETQTEQWAQENLVRFNKAVHTVWHLGCGNRCQYKLGVTGWSTALLKRTGGTAGWQLDMRQHCALPAPPCAPTSLIRAEGMWLHRTR